MTASGRLNGLRCLIVGGTSGIGLASAECFLAEGARVVVAGLDDANGAAAHERLGRLGEAEFVPCDIRSEAAVDSLFDSALDCLDGRLDVLFHVAGISGRRYGDGPLHECSAEGWQIVNDLNARGVFFTNRRAAQIMLAQRPAPSGLRGSVLNTGSVLGRSPAPRFFGTYAYAASKAAIEGMTRAAAAAYAGQGIRFNMLAPALVDTPMSARAMGDPLIQSYLATKQPLTAGPVSAEDCARAALWLCEPASRAITGMVLPVDGGWRISEGQYRDQS